MAIPYFANFGDTIIKPCIAQISDRKICLHCKDVCFETVCGECLAMSLDDRGLPLINEETCNGCALCYWMCDHKNVILTKK